MKKQLTLLSLALCAAFSVRAQAPEALYMSLDNGGSGWTFGQPFSPAPDGISFSFDAVILGNCYFHITRNLPSGWDDINWSSDNVYFNAGAGQAIEGSSDRLISVGSSDTYYLYGTYSEGAGCSVVAGDGSTYRFTMDFSGDNPSLSVNAIHTPVTAFYFHGNLAGTWDDEPRMTPADDGSWTYGPVTVTSETDVEFGIRSYLDGTPAVWYSAPYGTPLVTSSSEISLVSSGGVNIPLAKGTWSFTLHPSSMTLDIVREADPRSFVIDEIIGSYYLDRTLWTDIVWDYDTSFRGDNYMTVARGNADNRLIIRNLLGYEEEIVATFDPATSSILISNDFFTVMGFEERQVLCAEASGFDVASSYGFVDPATFAARALEASLAISRSADGKIILSSDDPIIYGREDFQDTDGWMYLTWAISGISAERRSERPALPSGEVYFDRKDFLGWDRVYVYCWSSLDGSNNKWPGEEITRPAGCDFFKAPFYDIYDSVVFNDGEGSKTEDIVGMVGGLVYVPQPSSTGIYPVKSNRVFWGGRIWFDNDGADWTVPHIHYWGFTSTPWPGLPMTRYDGSTPLYPQVNSPARSVSQVTDPEAALGLWYYDLPEGVAGIQFTDGVEGSGNESPVIVDILERGLYTAKGEGTTAIESVDAIPADGPVEYYNLQGVRVADPAPGLYIVRRGATVTKRLLP